MLLIGGTATIALAEDYLREISRRPVESTRELRLAHNLRHGHCGGMVSLIQVISTWSRKHESPVLLPYLGSGDPQTTIDHLVESPPGIVAVMMAKSIGPADDLKPNAYLAAKARIQRMDAGDYANTLKGPRVSLLVADQTSLRSLTPLYDRTADGIGSLRSEADFEKLANRLLSTAVRERRRDLRFSAVELGVFLRELFANTHDHARTDLTGVPYRRSVRGIYISHHLLKPNDTDGLTGGYAPLEEYINTIERSRKGITNQFLEISVYDSGPGMASRVLRSTSLGQHTIMTEYEAVLRCLEDRYSTTGLDGRGMGLPRMLERLKEQRGFLRLRTGRLSLYQSFASSRGPVTDPDRRLRDSQTHGEPEHGLPEAAGTVFTLLIPLRVRLP